LSEYTYSADKFVFHVRKDIQYSQDEVWVKPESNGKIRVGVTDFAQRRGGDIVFAEVLPVSTKILSRALLGNYETVKLVQDILSPVEGEIVQVNPVLESKPELINSDPYGEGWVAIIKPAKSLNGLLSADEYFELMKRKIAGELKKIKGI
jgi:glycine cleavage system H protein